MNVRGLCSSWWCCFNSAKLEGLWDVNLFDYHLKRLILNLNLSLFVSRFSGAVGWLEQQGHATALLSGGRLARRLCYCIRQVHRLLNKLIFHHFLPPAGFSQDDRDNLWQWRAGFLSLLRSPAQFQGHALITHMHHAVKLPLQRTAAKLLFSSPHAVSQGGRKRYSLHPPPPPPPASVVTG